MVNVLIIGAGEIGSAIGTVMEAAGMTVGYRDADETKNCGPAKEIDFMHICFGYNDSFVKNLVDYMRWYKPIITVINSTIPVGLTRELDPVFGRREYHGENWKIAHSPVRGRHYDLVKQIKMYKKYVGAIDEKIGREVAAHFWRAGIPSMYLGKPEITELGKLLDTSYYGACLALHQEYQRLCDAAGVSITEAHSVWNDDANDQFRKIEGCDHLVKPTLTPGFIGEHCVMPNLELLKEINVASAIGGTAGDISLIDFIKSSNKRWKEGK